MILSSPFKICPSCQHRWLTADDLIQDRKVVVNGYQASFDDSEEGLFLLTHEVEGCGTTFAVRAGLLKYLYDGPEYTIHMAFTPQCEEHCPNPHDLESCNNSCDMRWARDVLQILQNHGEVKVEQ